MKSAENDELDISSAHKSFGSAYSRTDLNIYGNGNDTNNVKFSLSLRKFEKSEIINATYTQTIKITVTVE